MYKKKVKYRDLFNLFNFLEPYDLERVMFCYKKTLKIYRITRKEKVRCYIDLQEQN